MATLYTQHFIQFFDGDGAPLAGGKLYAYEAGTTTPKDTYTDAGGGTPNPNPVVLDASGRATVFLSGSYKFKLTDSADVEIETTDNVSAFATTISGGVSSITSDYTEDVIATGDSVVFADASDGSSTKRDTIQGVLDLVPADLAGKTDTVITSGDKIGFFDASDSNNPKTDTVQGVLDLVATLGTPQTTTSGTSIDFTGIPSGVKRVSINFVGVSTSGTDALLVQIGDSGGIESTGYLGAGSGIFGTNSTAATNYTAGFGIRSTAAANVLHGTLNLMLVDSSTNTWVATGNISASNDTFVFLTSGSKSLSDVIDRVRITTTGGTNTFDAGSINIQYQ